MSAEGTRNPSPQTGIASCTFGLHGSASVRDCLGLGRVWNRPVVWPSLRSACSTNPRGESPHKNRSARRPTNIPTLAVRFGKPRRSRRGGGHRPTPRSPVAWNVREFPSLKHRPRVYDGEVAMPTCVLVRAPVDGTANPAPHLHRRRVGRSPARWAGGKEPAP
jgi:hypothetical protein